MFFDEGWVPLSDATTEVFRRLQGLQAAGKVASEHEGLGTLLAVTVWDICDASTKIGTTAADGRIIATSKELVAWSDPSILSNEHLDLRVGTVGSSSLPGDDGKMADRATLLDRYGPFLSLPVVVPDNNFQSSLTFLEEEAAKSPRDEEIVNAAKAIVTALDGGELVTRDTMRKKLGAGLSRRKFKLAWWLALQARPKMKEAKRWTGL